MTDFDKLDHAIIRGILAHDNMLSGTAITDAASKRVGLEWGVSDGKVLSRLKRLHASGAVATVDCDDPRTGKRRRFYQVTSDGERKFLGHLAQNDPDESSEGVEA